MRKAARSIQTSIATASETSETHHNLYETRHNIAQTKSAASSLDGCVMELLTVTMDPMRSIVFALMINFNAVIANLVIWIVEKYFFASRFRALVMEREIVGGPRMKSNIK